MKYFTLLIIVLLIIIGCKTSWPYNHYVNSKLPLITKEKEVFDLEHLFSKDPNLKEVKGIKIVKKRNSFDTLITTTKANYYSLEKGSKTIFYTRHLIFEDSTYVVVDYRDDPFYVYGIWKIYHPNGNIKTKGIRCTLGFFLGALYHFDENGNYIYSENTDEGYNFSFKKVFKVCKKYNIPLNRKTSIRKADGNWEISQMKRGCERVVLLDGNTGKELSHIIRNSNHTHCTNMYGQKGPVAEIKDKSRKEKRRF